MWEKLCMKKRSIYHPSFSFKPKIIISYLNAKKILPKDLAHFCLEIVIPKYPLTMTKISFDVDFSQDPEKILQEIQKRAEAEVANEKLKTKKPTTCQSSTSWLTKKSDQISKI